MKRWLLALLVFVGTLLGLEAAAYLLPLPSGAADPDAWSWRSSSARLGWTLTPGFRGEVYDAQRVVSADGLLDLDARQLAAAPQHPLVLALGDSRTFGNGVSAAETWVEELDRRLPGASVVNLGVPGYSVVQGVGLLEEKLAEWEGRVVAVVLAFGFNDRRYAAADGPDGPEVFARRAAGAQAATWFSRSRLMVQLQARLRARAFRPPLDLRTREPRVPLERFRSELERAIELCADRAVAVVALALPDNPEMAGPLETGEAAWEAGDRATAIAALATAVAQDDVFSDAARLALAAALESAAGPDAISEADRLVRSDRWLESESGGYPLASFRDYRSAMTLPRAETLDASEALDRPELFFDFVHFRPEGHRRLAELVAPAVRRRLP